MTGVWVLQVLTYLALVVAVVVIVRKTIRYATAPMHLRWDIYPVPHEVGKEYGGSYLEETDWWTKPRKSSLVNEIKAMVPEMLLIETLWKHNRTMWFVSFPFHGGIYVTVGFVGLLLVGAIAQAAGATVDAASGGLAAALHYLTIWVGVLGMLSVTVGALGLLVRRSTSQDLRSQSAPADYFNLAFILVIAVSGLVAFATVDSSFSLVRSYLQGLITFNPATGLEAAVVLEVVLISLWLLYMPFTHQTHFVGKYFTYHTVRWDDKPAVEGGFDQKLGAALERPVSWAAPHIGGGKWAEAATREIGK